MIWFKIVETDNFGGDYPDEKFVNLPSMSKKNADMVADAINAALCPHAEFCHRFWKVVPENYVLQPGFEP